MELRVQGYHKTCRAPRRKAEEICDKLDVPRLHPQESAFLKEYTEVLKPLAVAIDILHGESKCYLGF